MQSLWYDIDIYPAESLRDFAVHMVDEGLLGDIPDTLAYPPFHYAKQSEQLVLSALWALSRRDELTGAEQLVSGDRYLFIRDAYLQQRDYLIADGEVDDPFLD